MIQWPVAEGKPPSSRTSFRLCFRRALKSLVFVSFVRLQNFHAGAGLRELSRDFALFFELERQVSPAKRDCKLLKIEAKRDDMTAEAARALI